MICEKCKSEGLTSTILEQGSMTTAMHSSPYHDEKGVRHHHDPNIVTTAYECSRGHRWSARGKHPCPGCLWPREAPPAPTATDEAFAEPNHRFQQIVEIANGSVQEIDRRTTDLFGQPLTHREMHILALVISMCLAASDRSRRNG